MEIIKLDNGTPHCAECNQHTIRKYKVRAAKVEFIICHKCLSELKYACFPYTRWP